MLYKPMILLLLLVTVLSSASQTIQAQDPSRFAEQIAEYLEDTTHRDGRRPTLFVGSSSIRMWRSLSSDFPEHYVINRGFGGSHMSDLVHYYPELIKKNNPKQIFIYEGDNDLASGKSIKEIMDKAHELLHKISVDIPDAHTTFIAVKPSLSRWHLREKYLELNKELEFLAQQETNISFADVWTAMLGDNRLVRSDIFIEDGLHMNERGYKIWAQVIRPLLLASSE